MKNRCIIIGGAGFLGLNLAKRLLAENYDILIVDKVEPGSLPSSKADFIKVDLVDDTALKNVLRENDNIFYFACSSLPGSPIEQLETTIHQDVEQFVGIIKLSIAKRVGRIIFPSSGGTIYGNPLQIPITEAHPTNPLCYYGVMKLMNEKILYMFHQAYGLDYLILRIGNPFGPGQDPRRPQGLIPKVMKRMMNGEKIEIFGDGKIIRDYIYIDDVIDAMADSLSAGLKNEIYNIGSNVGTSINDVVKMASAILKKQPQITYLAKRPGDVSANILLSDKLSSAIGWRPKTSLAEGMAMTHRWLIDESGKY